jgi:hypothetical protein
MSETPLASVYISGRFAGSIFLRGGWGFEAIDARDCAIGMFKSQREAAAALQQVEMKSATVASNRTQASQFSQRHRRYLSPTSLAARRCSRLKRFDISYFFFADSSCRFFCVSCCFILWSVCRRAFLRLSDFVARDSHSHFGLFTAVASVRAMGQTSPRRDVPPGWGLRLWNEAVERNVKNRTK